MQQKGIIGFPFFYFLRIMILDFHFFFFKFSFELYNFCLNRDARPMFCNLNFTCMLWGVWTWLGDVASCLSFAWMLQFKMFVGFVVWSWLSYIFNFCAFITSSFANVGLGFVFHIHFQSSNIYIFRFLHFEIH